MSASANGAYGEPAAAIVADRREELGTVETYFVRTFIVIVGRGRPIVAVVAHISDNRAVAVARRRQEHCTSCLHLLPLGKGVAVACPFITKPRSERTTHRQCPTVGQDNQSTHTVDVAIAKFG